MGLRGGGYPRTGSTLAGVAPDPPANAGGPSAPVVTGTEAIGETLTCSTGTWTGTLPITYTYQWYRVEGAAVGVALTDEDGEILVDEDGEALTT